MTELTTVEELKQLAAKLKLHGLLAHWDELNEEDASALLDASDDPRLLARHF